MGQRGLFVSLLVLGAGLLAGPGRAHAQDTGLPGLGTPDQVANKPAPPPPDPPDSGATLDRPKAVEPLGPDKKPEDNKPPPAPVPPAPPVAPPAPPPAGPPAPPVSAPTPAPPTVRGEGGVSVEVVGPDRAGVGEVVAYEIRVRNNGLKKAARVRVEQLLVKELVLLRSDPPTDPQDRRLVWDLGDLDGGAVRVVKLEIQSTEAGELLLLPTVSFTVVTERTQLVRPPLSVTLSGPEKVLLGSTLVYEMGIRNNQDQPVTGVSVRADLPDALRSARGQHVAAPLGSGSLAPHETRTIRLEVTAVAPGPANTDVLVWAANGLQSRTRARLEVSAQRLALNLDAPQQIHGGEEVDIRLRALNPGREPAPGVRLALKLPAGVDYVAAGAGGQLNPDAQEVVWPAAVLHGGEERIVSVRLRGGQAGTWRLLGIVRSEQLGETALAQPVSIDGKPELVLELPPHDQPVPHGGEGVYELRVCNRGTAPAAGVGLSVTLPEGLVAVRAEGPTHAEVGEQNIQFQAMPSLPPRTDALYRIHLRGLSSGRGQLRAQITAPTLPPIRNEVAIYVSQDGSTQTGYRGPSRPP